MRKISPRLLFFLTICICILLLSACSQHTAGKTAGITKKRNFADIAMGGIVHIKMAGVEEDVAAKAAETAFATIDLLTEDFDHRSREGSIARVNDAAGKKPVVVSAVAFALIKRALDFAQLSSGVFDISIGAVTTTPFYYREKSAVDKDLVDYRKVAVDVDTRAIFLPKEGMALDVGGLAKGTIIDAAAKKIRQMGVPAALIEANGDFFCYGKHSWRVGIQDPRANSLLGVIEVKNAGVCGSGDYYQYDESSVEEEKRNHHIIDPSKLASAHKSIAVTAIAPSAELADALATTLFIMGPVKGLVFLEKLPNCSALWVLPNRQLVASPGFPSFYPSN